MEGRLKVEVKRRRDECLLDPEERIIEAGSATRIEDIDQKKEGKGKGAWKVGG